MPWIPAPCSGSGMSTMTDYNEEQEGELETLRCIYTDEEFTKVSENPYCFQIHISSSDDEFTVSMDMQFTYPATYPDVAPDLEVIPQEGLTEQHVTQIESFLREKASENVGMVMIFTIVSEAQEKLSELIDSFKEEKERVIREREEEQKRKEEAKFLGTIVTTEVFLEWRKRFEEEMNQAKSKTKETSSTKLTGRQMFEIDESLAMSDARFLTEASEVVETEDTVEVDESLFQDLDDLQL